MDKRIDIRIPEKLYDRAYEGDGFKMNVALEKVLTDGFFQKNTNSKNLKDFFASSPFNNPDSYKDDDLLFSDVMNNYVSKTTKFKTINEMIASAVEESIGVDKYI